MIGLLAAVSSTGPAGADCAPAAPGTPRLLVLTLDGVPLRAVDQARRQGAFEGWPATKALVSPFPSMTNVSFTAIFRPAGMGRISGYEMSHYNYEHNAVIGGGLKNYRERAYAWRDYYDVITRGAWAQRGSYLSPRKKVRKTLQQIEEAVLESTDEVVVAHISSTDSLAHFRGDEEVTEVVLEVSESLQRLRDRHFERHARRLRLVLLSDHGSTSRKVRFEGGLRDRIRDAGLRVNDKLRQPDDVVPVTYGVVGFGVLFTAPDNAEKLARVVTDHEGVDLSAWLAEPGELRVLGADAEARVLWRGEPGDRRIAYRADRGDPLRLAEAIGRLELDADGFASEDDWFDASALGDYPDAPRRLIDSLIGTYVVNTATVIVSFEPGYAWGIFPARLAAHLLGGKLEGTHGGLDRESTLGFFLTDDPQRSAPAVRADRALAPWSRQIACARRIELDDGEVEHGATAIGVAGRD